MPFVPMNTEPLPVSKPGLAPGPRSPNTFTPGPPAPVGGPFEAPPLRPPPKPWGGPFGLFLTTPRPLSPRLSTGGRMVSFSMPGTWYA